MKLSSIAVVAFVTVATASPVLAQEGTGMRGMDQPQPGAMPPQMQGQMPGMMGMHGGRQMRGMMGHGRMTHMRVMMILMDTNGDGALSLEEIQAAHERIFRAVDADSSGSVTFEEIQAFMRGPTATGTR